MFKKFIHIMEVVFVLLGALLCAMTPFWTIWAALSDEEEVTIGSSIILAVVVTLLWPIQFVGGLLLIALLQIDVIWQCVFRKKGLEECLCDELKTATNKLYGPYWLNYQNRKGK